MDSQHSLASVYAPSFLRDLSIWLVWRYIKREGKKPLKVPYYCAGPLAGTPRRGDNGTAADIAALTNFASARQYAIDHGYSGVGIAALASNGFTIIDFDNAVDETGAVIEDIISCADNTYAEYSPSKTGIHLFVAHQLGSQKSIATAGRFGIELFTSTGFVTFTGDILPCVDCLGNANSLGMPNSTLLRLIAQRFEKPLSSPTPIAHMPSISVEKINYALNFIDPDCDYHTWIHVGMALQHELGADGFAIWDAWSARGGKYSNVADTQQKWDSFKRTEGDVITGRSLLKVANDAGADIYTEGIDVSDFETINLNSESSTFFHIRSVLDFISHCRPPTWLIKNVLPQATLGVLYGESGSGKSFIALDICASLVRGVAWGSAQKPKRSYRVLYVVAEGVSGFALRLSAYCRQKAIPLTDLPIDIISDAPPNLMDGMSVKHLMLDIESRGRYDLIVMDTFAQVTSGANENSGEHMGRALKHCRQLSAISDAMVLLVHHAGKDASKGARGWSGVHAACDVVYEVTRFDNERCMRIVKQKDGIDGTDFGFSLTPVVLGVDEDGDDITSCVIDYHQSLRPPTVVKGDYQQLIIDVLASFSHRSWVSIDHLAALCVDKLPKTQGRDRRKNIIKQTINRAIGKFLEQNDNKEVRTMGTRLDQGVRMSESEWD